MPLTKATSNVVDLNKDTTINGITVGKGNNSVATNTALGFDALKSVPADSIDNTAIGYEALKSLNSGSSFSSRNTAIGAEALKNITSSQNNVAVGSFALNALTTGSLNTAIGTYSGYALTTGSSNISVGNIAFWTATTATNNTAIGYGALANLTTENNCSALGNTAQVTGANQVQLGNSTTTTYVYGTVQNRSDERDKADIRDTQLGLDFVKSLRPVDFKWDLREDYRSPIPGENATEEEKATYLESSKLANITHDGSKKRTRYHHGLIAQEVKAVLDAKGIDFGGYQDHSVKGGDDVLSIGYEELIAPMIKAIQELSAEVASLKAQLNP